MARIKKYASNQTTNLQPQLTTYQTFVTDVNPNSDYFRITEFKETFTGGKNGFLIEGSEHLLESTEIKIEILDVNGSPIYYEPGNGIPEYYEGLSKVIAVYVYEDTPIGEAKITILGELKTYIDTNGNKLDIPDEWKGVYNVKWERNFKVNRLLSNQDTVRFYKRPTVSITEIVKPIFSTTFSSVTKTGVVNGTAISPSATSTLSGYKLPTFYKLTTTDASFWTGSVAGTTLQLPSINYSPVVEEVLNSRELLVTNPYTDANGLVQNFTNKAYSATFNYLEGISNIASALTGSFAKIELTDLSTFVGDVTRVKIFRKSQSQVGDYQFVQEVVLESNELLVDLDSTTKNQENYGIFTQDIISNYWVASSGLTTTFNQNYLYDSVKLDSTTSKYFNTTKTISVTEGKEYSLSFNVRLAANLSSNNYIRAFLSGSRQTTVNGVPTTIQVQQTITTIKSDNGLLQKSTSTDNIISEQIDNAKLYFEVVGNGWYIANVSFTSAQETAFSPDEITFIQSVPRTLPEETFDYRFEFWGSNDALIPVLVEKTKTFTGGNLQKIQKSLVFTPRSLTFQFDSGSNPVPPTVVGFTITKNLLTGSVHFTSQSFDFDGNELTYSDYTASGHFPGLLNDITSDAPTMTVGNFTGSRSDKLVQLVKITGETEGYTDTVIFTRVLDGFGGVSHIIRPYRGTQIRNSSTSSLEIQAIRVDGINDIKISSTTKPEKGWPDIQLHVISASLRPGIEPEKFINLALASSSKFIKGLTTGSIGSREINYNATFNRDSIDTRRTIYLMSSASAASGYAYNVSSSVLTTIQLEDLQDGLDTGVIAYNSDVFNINYRNTETFKPVFAYGTASFTIRGSNSDLVTASFQVYPSMSINKDYVPEYWMYYTTQSCYTESIAISAVDENKNLIYSTPVNGLGLSSKQSKKLTITFTYTEPYTLAQTSIDKTFTIVPDGKPGDESIVFETNPLNVSLKANSRGVVTSYKPSITEIKLKQGSRYLVFTGSVDGYANHGTFHIAQESIISSSITGGLVYFDNAYTESLIISGAYNMNQLSASLTFPLIIHPYYTSSVYTASVVQNFTKTLDGPPPLQVIISPISTTINSDEVGYISDYTAANTTIQVKDGDDYLTFTTQSTAPGTFRIQTGASVIPKNIAIDTITSSSYNTAVVKFNHFEYPYLSASVDYNIVAFPYALGPGHLYTSSILTRTQTFGKNVATPAARSVTLVASSQTVNFDGDGVVTAPEGNITLTANAFNTTGSVYYEFFKGDNTLSETGIISDNYYDIVPGDATAPGEIQNWVVMIRDGNNLISTPIRAQGSTTISGIKAGSKAYTTSLTNENASAVYKVSGQMSLTGTGTDIRAYKGDEVLKHVSSFSPQTLNQFGEPIGSLGEYQVKIYTKSGHITIPGSPSPAAGDVVPTVVDAEGHYVARYGDLTNWLYPTTNQTATIVYEINFENGKQFAYKTQSLSVQFEGNTGPGIVMRGNWLNTIDYIGSVETTNYRRDAVIYPPNGNPTTYYAAISGSGPATYDKNHAYVVGAQAPSGTTADNAYWQYLGTQEFFVAAKIAIFDESYVKNTLNVGTKDGNGAFANIVLAGGRNDPYMAMGQTGTQGASGDQTSTGVIGYDRPGIFLGIYENGASGTTGRFSIKSSDGNRALKWDGDTLTIVGSINQVAPGQNAGTLRGAWAVSTTYYANDVVTYGGQSWQCTSSTSHTSTNNTNSSTGYPGAGPWTVAAAAGAPGANGTSGIDGNNGTSGINGNNGADGSPGPGVVYRGNYDSGTAYFHTPDGTRRDVVKYSGAYYLANNISKNGATTWGTPGVSDWSTFGATFSSVATDILLAQDSTITRGLVIGTDGSYTGYIRSANATSLSAGKGYFLNNLGQFRLGDATSTVGGKYLYWDDTDLVISGIIRLKDGNNVTKVLLDYGTTSTADPLNYNSGTIHITGYTAGTATYQNGTLTGQGPNGYLQYPGGVTPPGSPGDWPYAATWNVNNNIVPPLTAAYELTFTIPVSSLRKTTWISGTKHYGPYVDMRLYVKDSGGNSVYSGFGGAEYVDTPVFDADFGGNFYEQINPGSPPTNIVLYMSGVNMIAGQTYTVSIQYIVYNLEYDNYMTIDYYMPDIDVSYNASVASTVINQVGFNVGQDTDRYMFLRPDFLSSMDLASFPGNIGFKDRRTIGHIGGTFLLLNQNAIEWHNSMQRIYINNASYPRSNRAAGGNFMTSYFFGGYNRAFQILRAYAMFEPDASTNCSDVYTDLWWPYSMNIEKINYVTTNTWQVFFVEPLADPTTESYPTSPFYGVVIAANGTATGPFPQIVRVFDTYATSFKIELSNEDSSGSRINILVYK
jgi:hypothetical protein